MAAATATPAPAPGPSTNEGGDGAGDGGAAQQEQQVQRLLAAALPIRGAADAGDAAGDQSRRAAALTALARLFESAGARG